MARAEPSFISGRFWVSALLRQNSSYFKRTLTLTGELFFTLTSFGVSVHGVQSVGLVNSSLYSTS